MVQIVLLGIQLLILLLVRRVSTRWVDKKYFVIETCGHDFNAENNIKLNI